MDYTKLNFEKIKILNFVNITLCNETQNQILISDQETNNNDTTRHLYTQCPQPL